MVKHSPLGASGAERWMNCPGSIGLLQHIGITDESDEPDYRAEGTAAHELAATCLLMGTDPWEYSGQAMSNGIVVDPDMVQCVDVYVNAVRQRITHGQKLYVEYGISSPVHPDFYGTLDAAVIDGLTGRLFDYKHGVGVIVEVEHNPQFMYYAYGLLEQHPELTNFEITVAQPRAFHPDGPVRSWSISAEELRHWAQTVLVPAMDRTSMDHSLDAGEWCRFCPAKLVCPLLNGLFRAAAVANPGVILNLDNERLGREWNYIKGANMYRKALEEEVMRRSMAGQQIPTTKLVLKKADRVFRPGAVDVFISRFGEDAYTKPELKTPAQMEKLGPQAAELVHEYSYTPQTGYTVVAESDKRPAVTIQPLSQTFAGALDNAD